MVRYSSAQEVPPMTPGDPVSNWDLLANTVISLVLAFAVESPLVVLIVSIVKRFTSAPGNMLQLAVGTIILVLTGAAVTLGYQPQFDTAVKIIMAVGTAILNILSTFGFSSAQYQALKAMRTPFFGFARTK